LVNQEMVELEPLDDEDQAFLFEQISRHREETNSAVAQALLADWEASLGKFVKVMPRDYKRVLEAARDAEARGLPVTDAIMEAAHG
jgi:glutamate synthase (NADPH/NADH) large chain